MTDAIKATEAKTEPAKVTVTVTAEAGVTFARKEYKKGDSITCTADQKAILAKQGVTGTEV